MVILETENLTKQFGRFTAVDNVSLAVQAGNTHSIIGPNGAGKSTLFNLITGLHEPTGGSVLFKGEDIARLSPRQIVKRGISRSFQIVDLFEGLTVEENVRIAAQSLDDRQGAPFRHADTLTDTNERAARIVDDVEMREHIDTRASALSHGDRKKLEIGLGIAVEPELFLLDEPTAGMGEEESVETVRMVREVAADQEITPVFIEHDPEIVMEISDVVTVLHEGAVLEQGTPAEIKASEDVQRAYLGTEA
jgi:branched-chain amino acid transport system ATP-binding protein